jgi:hypothetical protein
MSTFNPAAPPRLERQRFTEPRAASHGQIWLYVTPDAREKQKVLEAGWFNSVADFVARSDTIKVVITSPDFDETCELVVTAARKAKGVEAPALVVVEEWTPWRRVPSDAPDVPAEAPTPAPQPEPPSQAAPPDHEAGNVVTDHRPGVVNFAVRERATRGRATAARSPCRP